MKHFVKKLFIFATSIYNICGMDVHNRYLSESNQTDSSNIKEHEYGVFEVVVDTDFSNTMKVSSAWCNDYKNDLINALNINSNRLLVLAIRETNDEPGVLNIVYNDKSSSDSYGDVIKSLTTLIEDGYDFPNMNTEIKAITYNENTIYEKTRWQKIKSGANDRWDAFSNTEVGAPIVAAWSLGIGIPFAIMISFCIIKYRRIKDTMRDEGVVSVKLSTRKTIN